MKIGFFRRNGFAIAAMVLAGFLASTEEGHSTDRRFVYSYEAQPFLPGQFEMETWLTWKDTGSGSGSYTFRHEFEYAFTEKFQLGFYLPTWSYSDDDGSNIKSIDLEAIYNLTSPNESWIGSSIYGEVKVWDEFLKLEGKALFQKNFGPVAVVYNAIIEGEWEGSGLNETEGELKHTLGVSYMNSPRFAFGVEGLQEVKIPGWSWSDREAAPVYLGPNVSARVGRNWFTIAVLWELTSTEEEDFQVRALWGLLF